MIYNWALTDEAQTHLDFWEKTGNKTILKKIKSLVDAIDGNPFVGIGKPEQLKYHLSGYWSRRITNEHRIVYGVEEDLKKITIVSLRFHY